MTSAFGLFTYTLSGAEADAITNYNDLRLRFDSTSAFFGIDSLQVSQAFFEIPDAGGAAVGLIGTRKPLKRTDLDLILLLEAMK